MRSIFCAVLLATAVTACTSATRTPFRHELSGTALPWTHTRFDTSAGQFTFAVVSDLNGGERPTVFSTAVAQLSILHPELVLSVGDLIDGPTPADSALTREWNDFDARASAMPAPFFRVGGNHDLTGDTLRTVWRSRYGPTYYSFVYRNALFLILDTEDLSPERARAIFEARNEALQAQREGRTGTEGLAYYSMPERAFGDIGAEQAAYVQGVLAKHRDVRWTFVFFHKPVWRNPNDPDFKAIEAALANRPYTVFSGHLHSLNREERLGREYFTLGTTGGSQNPSDPMALDHVTLVTMTATGPSIAHLRLDGILGADGRVPKAVVPSP
jgi:hypothetical protein